MTDAPLRILQVNSRFNGGGLDNQTLNLAAGLHDLGQHVLLAVATASRWEPLARRLPVSVATFPPRSALQHVKIRRWGGLLRQHRVQILHAHQGNDYWPAVAAARLAACGTRVVITRHLMTRPRTFSRLFLLRFAHVIAVSRSVRALLEQELHGPPRRIHQVNVGIDMSPFQTERSAAAWEFRQSRSWPQDAVVLGVVGGFAWPHGKGQPEFLEAAARIHGQFPQARFTLVGEGSMEPYLRERIASLGLSDVASLIPFTQDIPTLMSALDVLVHPPVHTEAFGLVTIEALASAKPVIASRLQGVPEAFHDGEHGLLVPPGDVPALAKAMRDLLLDPEKRHRFGQAGSRHVRANFTREILARRTLELYRRLSPSPPA